MLSFSINQLNINPVLSNQTESGIAMKCVTRDMLMDWVVLFIAEAFPCKAGYIQGTRKHARGRFGRVQ